jgi:hypothetical protein
MRVCGSISAHRFVVNESFAKFFVEREVSFRWFEVVHVATPTAEVHA